MERVRFQALDRRIPVFKRPGTTAGKFLVIAALCQLLRFLEGGVISEA